MNIIAGMIMPLTNWAPKLAPEQPLVALGEDGRDLLLPAEHLDQRVPGEGLLDVAVELAGRLPLLR